MGQEMTCQCFQKKSLDLKQLKNILKIYLGKKLGQMDQSGTSRNVYSRLSANSTLPPSGKSVETGNLVPFINQEHCLNTSWKLSFLNVGVRLTSTRKPRLYGFECGKVELTFLSRSFRT